MNHRIIALSLFALSLAVVGIGYLIWRHPDYLGLCEPGIECLSQDVLYGIAKPIYFAGRWLPVVFLALAFVGRKTFITWCKIFIPVGIVMLWFLYMSDPTPNDFFPIADRLDISLMLAKYFVLGSLLLLGADSLRRRFTNH